jgi:hypothetical protein
MSGSGRPTLYRPENDELARKFCLLGATNEDLAGLFDVAVRTIDNWLATLPGFAAAVKQGRAMADADVVQSLHSRATGYSYQTEKIFHFRGEVQKVPHTVHFPPDTTACMFWLRNRRPGDWRQKADPAFDPVAADMAAVEAAREAALETIAEASGEEAGDVGWRG